MEKKREKEEGEEETSFALPMIPNFEENSSLLYNYLFSVMMTDSFCGEAYVRQTVIVIW